MNIILRFIPLCFSFLFLLAQISYAATEQRTALVIGNGAYASGRLKNPVNDATDMAAALRKLGFSVVLKTNARYKEMLEAIENFGNNLKKGGVGLFYFAGHGVQVGGVNYLFPIGARINKEKDVQFEALDAGRILAEMETANNGLNIVILDACRDNPFARSFRSASRGLAIVTNAPSGTFISYSTAAGQVARDGEGRNSPYTKALLQYMQEPGVPIGKVFMKVRQELRKETGQVPWELSSLEGDFYFIPDPQRKITTAEAAKKPEELAVLKPPPSLPELAPAITHDRYFGILARDGYTEALNYFNNAVTTSPDDADARAGLAIASIFKGDEDTAKYNIRRIRELNQQTKWTRVAAGFIEGLGQDYEGGKYQLSRAMEEGADRSLVYLCRGFIHEKHRNFDLAKKEMESYRGIVRTDEQGQPYKELALRVKRNECVANDGRFCKYQDGTVLDTSTNLMWAAKDNGSDINWQNAKRYCENYRGGGYTDWRMPTQDELAGLYDESKRNQHGYRVTNLIEITRCCPWASETRGSDAAYVVFDGFRRDWSHQSDAYVLRALPVRSGK